MIVDVHRHMWSAAQRHPVVREIAHSTSQVRYHQPDEVPLVPDVDSTADAIVAEMDEAGVDVSVLLMATTTAGWATPSSARRGRTVFRSTWPRDTRAG